MAPSPQLSTNCTKVISKISFVADCTTGAISSLNLFVLLASSDGPGTANTTTSTILGVSGIVVIFLPIALSTPERQRLTFHLNRGRGIVANAYTRLEEPSHLAQVTLRSISKVDREAGSLRKASRRRRAGPK